MNDHNNIARIRTVFNALGNLGDNVVFVGGAVVSLYRDRPASETRITDDIDIVVEVINYANYADLEDQLRMKGFANDSGSGVICRYKIHDVIVDVMPTNEKVLGFNNKWYPDGFRNAIEYSLDDRNVVKIFSAVYFIASKIDAFNDRGRKDGRTSTDFEDIVYILNNRSTIWDEMKVAPVSVRIFLYSEFRKLIKQNYIHEWISCHMEYGEQRRVDFIVNSLINFAGQ